SLGYTFAEVTARVVEDAGVEVVTFSIIEGSRLPIRKIALEGVPEELREAILAQLETRPLTAFGSGGYLIRAGVAADLRRIEQGMRDAGYQQAVAIAYKVARLRDGSGLDVAFSVQAGERLTGGSFNLGNPLVMRVTGAGDATRLAAILRLAERAAGERPRLAQLADRVAKYFVAVLLVIAAAVAVVWSAIDPAHALAVTIAVLVVSCPCALSLATPAALGAASGSLHKQGVLITRGNAIEGLANATDIVFDKTGTLTTGQMHLRDAITLGTLDRNTVLAWAAARGDLLEKGNSSGWWGIVCPNSAEHSDGNPMGRYHPVNRAYCCLHEHCAHLDSVAYLAWVEEHGGPKRSHGLRDELLAAVMENTLSKLTPTVEYPNDAATVIAEVEHRELGRVEMSGWFERFAYIQNDDAYFDMEDRREVMRKTFNALFRHINCKSRHGKHPKVEASVSFDEYRQDKGARALVGITYAAGESVLVAREGLVYGNRWRDARPEPVAADVSAWLRHVERMVPIEFEREHLLNALAHKVQFPSHKINHAILLGGNHGSGKDTLFAPFFWAIGGKAKANCSLVKNEDLNSQWGYALECEVMEIAELRQAEAKDRRALENTLKPIIAAPPELLMVNRKGLHPYYALNRVFVVAFSNERVAISLPSEDRRWFVLWSEAGKLPEAEAVALWNWYEHRGGFAAVAAYLHTRDVSAWNPNAAPPMTEAKMIMVEHGMSGAESFLVNL
ncbi:MAG: hypothetical protein EBY24_21625, partial [Betaproteobacteria bacterium]|nr:hypothetical protein [Betaproteobacteria bacterium]